MTAPTTEPASARAGDSWAWRREDLPDYPATLWALKYSFKNATSGFEIAASADGTYFAVAVAGDDTENYAAGIYSWAARISLISDSTTRHTVDAGTLEILPSLFTTTATDPLDNRSVARKMLDQCETALLAFQAGVKSYTIGSRMMTYRDAPEVEKMRDRWRLAVAREDQREGRPNNISRDRFVRFGRA